jgi:hypothetical protein
MAAVALLLHVATALESASGVAEPNTEADLADGAAWVDTDRRLTQLNVTATINDFPSMFT